jgi:aldose 1-epimerase
MASITRDTLYDIPGYRLNAAGFTAFICPKMGANCIEFSSDRASYLRTPMSYSNLRENPNLFGMPILFPPNRIQNGKFFFNGTEYLFPINEPKRGHHIHGLLSSSEFIPLDRWFTNNNAFLSFYFEATQKTPYLTFPHAFKLTITYLLDNHGLTQHLILQNKSHTDMPFGLGLHTTLNNAFLFGTNAHDYLLKIPVSQEIHFDKNTIIPTGEKSTTQLSSMLNVGSLCPQSIKLSNLFSVKKEEIRAAVYIHVPTTDALMYKIEKPYDYWMVYNADTEQEFLCLEPQSWIIDAPNSQLTHHHTGFRTLSPDESITLACSLQPTKMFKTFC